MATVRELEASFTAKVDSLKSSVRDAKRDISGLKKETEETANVAGRNWTRMGETLQKQSKWLTDNGKKVQNVGKKWTKTTALITGAATAVGAAVFGLTNKITKNAEEIDENAKKMGITTDAYQEMSYWAKENGLSQDQFDKAMGRLNQRMGQAADGNEKYASALEALGINMDDVRDGTLSTEDAFVQSISALSKMDNEQEKVSKATELFGTRMARDLMPALQDGSLSIEEARKEAEKLGIVMSVDQIKAAKEFQAQYRGIKTQLGAVAQEIGLSLMPYLQELMSYIQEHMPQIRAAIVNAFESGAERIKSFIEWFQALSPPVKKATGVIAGLTLVMGPLLSIFGKVMQGVSPLIGGFSKLATKIGKMGGLLPALKAAFTALTGPVGITVAVIGTLVAGFITAYKKSETFRNIINQLRDGFVRIVGAIKEFLTTNPQILAFVDGVKSAFVAMKNVVQQAIDGVFGFFKRQFKKLQAFWDAEGAQFMEAVSNVFKMIWAVVGPVIKQIFNLVKTTFPIIKTIIVTAFKVAAGIVKSVWQNIKGIIIGALDVIMGLVKTFSGLFTGDFSKMWEGIKQIFKGALKAVWNFVQIYLVGRIVKLAGRFIKLFRTPISKMWKFVKGLFERSLKAVTGTVKRGFNAISKFIRTIFNAIKTFFSTVWNGIKKVFTTVIRSIVNFAKRWFTNFKKNVRTIFSAIRKFFSTIWSGIKKIFTTVIRAIVNFGKKTFNGFKNTIRSIFNGIKKIASSIWNGIKKVVVNPISNLVKRGKSMFNSFKKKVSDIFGKIKDSVSDKITGMIDLIKDMPGKMKKGITDGAGAIKKGFLFVAAKMVDGVYAGVNGIIDGINWAWNKLGGKKDKFNHLSPSAGWYKKATSHSKGTEGHPGGPALLNDGRGTNSGQELVRTPDGTTGMFKGKNVYANLPKGSQVWSARETKQMPAYAWGTGALKKGWNATKSGIAKAGKWTGDKAKAAGEKVKDGTLWAGKKLKAGAKAVMNQGLKVLGINTPKKHNSARGLIRRGFLESKDLAVGKLKEKIKELKEKFTGGIDGDLFGKNFRMSSDYGNRVINGSNEFHKGVDFAADKGTPIHALMGGKVIHAGEGGPGSGYNGYGKSVALRVGDHDHLYGHMSRVYSKKGQDIKKDGALGEVGATGQATGNHVHFEIRKKGTLDTVDPNKLFGTVGGSADPKGTGVKRWRPYVIKALKKNGLSTSYGMVQKVLRQIATESGGDPKAVQNPDVDDINMRQGNPARGLMQTIPQTFSSFAHNGHTKITNGYDNLLAALAYAKDKSIRQYGNKNLPFLGKGHGYKNGGIVDTKQLAWLAEGGWAESVISHDPAKRNSQRKIWQETGDDLGFTEHGGNNEILSKLERIAQAVECTQDTALLRDIAKTTREGKTINVDGDEIAEVMYDRFKNKEAVEGLGRFF